MQLPEHSNKIALHGFQFDLEHLELHDAAGERVALRPRTLAVLNCLARQAGHVVTKDHLMRAAWPGVVVTDDSLVQCVGELRRALRDDQHAVVKTEPRRGYRLVVKSNGTAVERSSRPPSSDDFRQQIHFAASTDGIRIAYATSGDGPALVRTAQWMTHLEWDWRSAVFGEFIQRLSNSNRLVRYDPRGCGLSDRGVPMGTLDDEVRDLEAVVEAAGLDRFALIARSQGGAIAVRYAALHPERVVKLIVMGGFARGRLKRGATSTPLDEVIAFCKLVEGGWGEVHSAFRQMWTQLAFPGASAKQHDAYNHLQRVSSSPQDAAQIVRMMGEYDATADLERVECPTLVLHNPRDGLVPFEEGRLLASMVKGALLEPFDSLNHVPLPGEPAFEPMMKRIHEFLADDAPEQRARPRFVAPAYILRSAE
jgi:pimeloyl-ACP methyl ester carboxylesterase/DNA-binding winged helix-turn-helix (wHTH) protein